MITKKDAIDFLTIELSDKFSLFVDKAFTYYTDMESFLVLNKSINDLQDLDKYLYMVEQGLKKAYEMRDFFESLILLNKNVEHEIAPLISEIDNWDLLYSTLESLQELHRRNLRFYISCMEAGCTDAEFDSMFHDTRMSSLLAKGLETLKTQKERIRNYSSLKL